MKNVTMLLFVLVSCLVLTSWAQDTPPECRDRTDVQDHRPLSGAMALPLYAFIINYRGYFRKRISERKPDAPIECLYEDKQKKWWFAVDSNFPIMRVVNERCVICYDCSLTGSNCMSIPGGCFSMWFPDAPEDNVFKPFARLHR